MSMPSFPKDGTNITREQALTMVIASIAMEECALGRVIDAEGDKLRYILDKCRETCGCGRTPKEILEVNCSVTKLLDVVAQNQMILRSKLALALSAGGGCPPAPPCPPPCPPKPSCSHKPPCPPCPKPPQKCLGRFKLPENGFLWKRGCLMPWEPLDRCGSDADWCMGTPCKVRLDTGRACSVACTFIVRDLLPAGSSGCIRMEGASRDLPPLRFSARCASGEPVTLQYTETLLPGSAPSISFRLCSSPPLWVEQAELNIVEL